MTQLDGLAHSHPPAQLKALLPKIDEIASRGVRQEAIAEILCAVGIRVTYSALRSALSRWRKKHKQGGSASAAQAGAPTRFPNTAAAPISPSDSAVLSSATASPRLRDKGYVTPTDLKRLRENTHIDLNELAELGRRK